MRHFFGNFQTFWIIRKDDEPLSPLCPFERIVFNWLIHSIINAYKRRGNAGKWGEWWYVNGLPRVQQLVYNSKKVELGRIISVFSSISRLVVLRKGGNLYVRKTRGLNKQTPSTQLLLLFWVQPRPKKNLKRKQEQFVNSVKLRILSKIIIQKITSKWREFCTM